MKHSTRPALLAALTALAALLGTVLVVVPTAAPASAVVTPRIVLQHPKGPIARTLVVLRGTLSGPSRPVLAQERRGSRWVTVGRSGSYFGSYTITVRDPRHTGNVAYRTVARRTRLRGGRVLTQVVSRPVTVRVVPLRVRWRMPTTARVDDDVTVHVRLSPARKGVPVTVQQLVNGHWEYRAATDAGLHEATLTFTQITTGPSRFRLYVGGGHGLATKPRTLGSTPSGVVLPTRRVSVTSNGSQLSSGSDQASVSDDGRYVAFVSDADNAVPGDTNKTADVFLKDTTTGAVTLVSRGRGGHPADRESESPAISGDGRFVVFVSRASNLVAGDTNKVADVFVWERASGAVTRIGSKTSRAPYRFAHAGPSISSDGRYVAYDTGVDLAPEDHNGLFDVYLRDRVDGTDRLVSQAAGAAGNGASLDPAISADGRYVAFRTGARNLTADGVPGVLRWDATTGASKLASVTATGAPVRTYLGVPQISGDGSVIAFEADDGPAGGFDTHQQVYARDVDAATTTLVSGRSGVPGDGDSFVAALTDDGSQVLITSAADLVDDDEDTDSCEAESDCPAEYSPYDAFVVDVATGVPALVSRTWDGKVSDYFAEGQDLVGDGSMAVIGSEDHLVPGVTGRGYRYDTGYWDDVYVRDLP